MKREEYFQDRINSKQEGVNDYYVHLEVKHLKITYKKGKNLINAVEDISFQIQTGECLVQEVCDRVLVMHNGWVVEEGTPDQIIMHPREAYTQKLIESIF